MVGDLPNYLANQVHIFSTNLLALESSYLIVQQSKDEM